MYSSKVLASKSIAKSSHNVIVIKFVESHVLLTFLYGILWKAVCMVKVYLHVYIFL